MTDDDVRKRLRESIFLAFEDGTKSFVIAPEAAEIIEALTAELANEKRMRQEEKAKILRQRTELAALDAAHRKLLSMAGGLQRRVAVLEAAEAENDRLRAALAVDPWHLGRREWKRHVIAAKGQQP